MTPPRRSTARRLLWFAAGWASVAVGAVGVIVPGLPTTVFFIVAAACFSHSSPRFERWVLDLPGVGAAVRDHREGLGMPRRAKWWAIGMIAACSTVSGLLLLDRPVAVAGVAVLALVGVGYVGWRVPTRERVLERRAGLVEQPAG